MVSISVDESYAFDYLSIAELKSLKHPDSERPRAQYLHTVKSIVKELGKPLFRRIVHSREYGECVKANLRVYALVELAKNDGCTASEVDRANYRRCVAKEALQRKFFNSGTSELKFGYEAYDGENRQRNR